MDRDREYRGVVRCVLQEFADCAAPYGDLHGEIVCDDASGHYHVGEIGWENGKRIERIFVHLDVRDGKIWIEQNNTETEIAPLLVEAGVPKEHIVIGLLPPNVRKDTDYAVA